MSQIRLTEEQRRLIDAGTGCPAEVIDPVTSRTYVLVASEDYDKVRALLGPQPAPARQAPGSDSEVPPGILRSQQAFWRELPELLRGRRNRGKWVCYHGDERVGIGAYDGLIRECLRRGIPPADYTLFQVRPRELPPWEPEDIEPLGARHFDDDEDFPAQFSSGP